jgi:hypothetical protein
MMNTQGTDDRADEVLRALLSQADPEPGSPTDLPPGLFDRVLTEVGHDPSTTPVERRPGWIARHWQPVVLAVACVATVALAVATVVPNIIGTYGSNDSAAVLSESAPSAEGAMDAPQEQRSGTPVEATDAKRVDEALVRTGSLLVGSEEIQAARDEFVSTILAMGGRVTSESVVTDGAADPVPYGPEATTSMDSSVAYPYPWYPDGPGVWLTVEVPVDRYDDAMRAAGEAGEVVRMQQSTYDVGAQVADVDARVAALRASLARLTTLMDQATDITDVISLEEAISARQSELDALRAQQRELANSTAMSQISLILMSPDDARGSVSSGSPQTWWESFLGGLSQFWSWLGQALLILSPLLIALAIIWWVRRRAHRGGAVPRPAQGGPDTDSSAPGGEPTG